MTRRSSSLVRARLGVASTAVVLLLLGGGGLMQAAPLALDGIVALADTCHRERWGSDGYHAANVLRAVSAGEALPAGPECWASDNWEVTHALVLVFPREVALTALTLHWPVAGGTPLSARRVVLQGLQGGRWAELAEVRHEHAALASRAEIAGAPLAAVRVVQAPADASPAADRRLWLAGIVLEGTPVEPPRAVDTAALSAQCQAELQAQRRLEDAARVAPALAVAMHHPKPSGFMGIIDRADLERGRQNVATRGWAKALADSIRKDADWWLEQPDDRLYNLVPTGNPRALCPQFEKGCPLHGGARGTFTATLERPFVWRCSKGGEEWYDGAVVKHPQSGAEITVRDAGEGWLAPAGFPQPGRRYYFVAAYRYFVLGKLFGSIYEGDGGSLYRGGPAARQLALAYAISGDPRYAHKAAVLLNRLAEVYRTYDGCVEGPSQRQDGYIGQTFERFTVQEICLAVDLIWDEVGKDAELWRFFAAKGAADYDGDGQVGGADITYNLQRNLLGFIYEYLHRLMPYMDGDFIMYEMTGLAAVARVLGNADLLAEALDSDLGLGVLLRNSWFRDGKFIYDSTGYNVGNAQTPLLIAEWLHGMSAPPRYPVPLDLYHDPAYRMSMLFDFLRDVDCDGRPPQIGDGGGSRGPVLRALPPYDTNEERAFLRLPEQREVYRARLLAASGGDLEAFRGGRADWWLLFHAEAAPAAAPAGAATPAPGSASHLFDDSGIAILRAGKVAAERQHVCLTFSKGSYGHGHGDKLALNLIRYGYDLTADLGYPTTWTDLKYPGWETHTASHCTVMLDETPQTGNVCGRLHFYACSTLADVVEASAEAAYPDASLYRRTLASVRDGQGEALYTVDLFRAAGATTRDYLFHALGRPEELTVSLDDPAAAWSPQPDGSLAGPEVAPMTRPGLSFLHQLQRARTAAGLRARWQPVLGSEQPDRYLLTRQRFRGVLVEFTMVRTGKAAGPRNRATFLYGVPPPPAAPDSRHIVWLDGGSEGIPVGVPVRVRIEIHGATAAVTFDGKAASRGLDTTGTPVDEGVVGFLHYYNYGYEYRDLVFTPAGGAPLRIDLGRDLDPDFWGQIDPTYQAGAGCLSARDSQSLGVHLHLLGAPGREVIRAQAEGYGLRGNSPFEGHLVVRENSRDKARTSTFAGVIETTLTGPPRVLRVERVAVTAGQEQAWEERAGVALRVTCAEGPTGERTDYVFSALRDDAEFAFATAVGEIRFQGCFGLLATRGGGVVAQSLVGSGRLACGARRIEVPAPVRGVIAAVEVEHDAIVIRLDAGSPDPSDAVGRKLLVTHRAFVCPAVYTVLAAEPAGAAAWRLRLNLPLTVAAGEIGSVEATTGSFASATPIMKLRVNPGLFDGKHLLLQGAGAAVRLQTASESAFVLAAPGTTAAVVRGKRFSVLDVGVDDRIEIVPQGE